MVDITKFTYSEAKLFIAQNTFQQLIGIEEKLMEYTSGHSAIKYGLIYVKEINQMIEEKNNRYGYYDIIRSYVLLEELNQRVYHSLVEVLDTEYEEALGVYEAIAYDYPQIDDGESVEHSYYSYSESIKYRDEIRALKDSLIDLM